MQADAVIGSSGISTALAGTASKTPGEDAGDMIGFDAMPNKNEGVHVHEARAVVHMREWEGGSTSAFLFRGVQRCVWSCGRDSQEAR